MGKKTYHWKDVSLSLTKSLGINSLLVLAEGSSDICFHTIHKRYFEKGKCICPACHSEKTRTSKVISRKFKDIIIEKGGKFRIIDIVFEQRYFRCDNCKDCVFPEEIDFAEKGSRYTNRLADKLADGTFQYSYKKVCEHYGVPASTASVGAIMRRRIHFRESQLPPLYTPEYLSIVELEYLGNLYPLISAVTDSQIYCMDILKDTSEDAYTAFFRSLDVSKVKCVFMEPNEELRSAIISSLPSAGIVLATESIVRHATNSFKGIIRSEGKRFPIRNKESALTKRFEYLGAHDKGQIEQGMLSREKLHVAYDQFQSLLKLAKDGFNYQTLSSWASSTSSELSEFEDLNDVISCYEPEIKYSVESSHKIPSNYAANIQNICEAISDMPKCIFDVLRARCMLTCPPDTIIDDEQRRRRGIPAEKFIDNINSITDNIMKEREYNEF